MSEPLTPAADCLVMAKPAGPKCNLRCAYCYYVGKDAGDFAPSGDLVSPSAAKRPGRLSDSLLARYVAQGLAASPGPVTHFEWHGGEPTLLGLDWFRRLVRLQKKLCPPGRRITNGLQTNGLLITEAWAGFLRDEGFSVGLSLDGPEDCHDIYRRTVEGGPSHARVLRAFERLRRAGCFTNVLCVVHKANVGRAEEVYGFFRDIGVTRLQFLPLVTGTRKGEAHELAAGREELGDFLCRIFDLWMAEDVGKMIVQTFDEALRPIHGLPHALCIHRPTCGDVAALETDGGFYACDHFVDPEHRLGSIVDSDIASLAADPRMKAFGVSKREGLAAFCRSCEVLSSCNGGCPKDRISPAPVGSGLVAWFCPSWKAFFTHARPGLEALSAHMKAGRPLRDFRQTASIS
ncbi:MAG TPA: anaerobic sulfatase maturase [Rectinemataceae bacterium]|nr:anaerobic sulfatase maturase [Rectinemataceae bacterium]